LNYWIDLGGPLISLHVFSQVLYFKGSESAYDITAILKLLTAPKIHSNGNGYTCKNGKTVGGNVFCEVSVVSSTQYVVKGK
jgi:hypothetical protein